MLQPNVPSQSDEGRAAIVQPPNLKYAFVEGGEVTNTQGVDTGSLELRGSNVNVEPIEGELASSNMEGDLSAREDPIILTESLNCQILKRIQMMA